MSRENLLAALRQQSQACAHLGSEFTGNLLETIAQNLPFDGKIWEFLQNWEGDIGPYGASLPLRLAGALHALVLHDLDKGLKTAYPPNPLRLDQGELWRRVDKAINLNSEFVLNWLQSAPQTNEVSRAAVLVPGFMEIIQRTGINRFVTSELGASAGLNMIWDHYRYQFGGKDWGNPDAELMLAPEVTGALPDFSDVKILDRSGCDLNPIPIDTLDAQLRLKPYVWPDQEQRLSNLDQAIATRNKFDEKVEKSDAINWLKKRLSRQTIDAVHVVYHTIAWQYFPADKQAEGTKLLEDIGRQATHSNPLAWLRLEADGENPGAALKLTLWPAGDTIKLARADFHGRWINWLI